MRKYFILLGILMVMALIVAGWEWRSPDSFIKQLELPEVARYLPTDDPSKATVEFNTRIQAKYPTGIMESDLISRLSKDGFNIYLRPERLILSVKDCPALTITGYCGKLLKTM
jgi:hypothetical protein